MTIEIILNEFLFTIAIKAMISKVYILSCGMSQVELEVSEFNWSIPIQLECAVKSTNPIWTILIQFGVCQFNLEYVNPIWSIGVYQSNLEYTNPIGVCSQFN